MLGRELTTDPFHPTAFIATAPSTAVLQQLLHIPMVCVEHDHLLLEVLHVILLNNSSALGDLPRILDSNVGLL